MTLKSRLDGVYRQYGQRRPDVAFATAEVLRSALYSSRGGSAYLGRWAASLPDDVASLEHKEPGSVSFADAVAFYFREFLGKGRFYEDREPAAIHTKFDRLVPWVARTIAADPSTVEPLLRAGALDRIADWVEAERPDLMRLSLKQVLYRERRWHAALARQRKALRAKQSSGYVVMRFSDGWTVHQLETKEQLGAEGEAMGHCVGGPSYARRCAEKLIEIYSMRDENGVPRYTIEIGTGVYRSVRQVKGVRNARAKLKDDCRRILAFLDQLPGIQPFDTVHDLEHCLRKAGRWVDDIRDVPPPRQNPRRTSRRRISRRRTSYRG